MSVADAQQLIDELNAHSGTLQLGEGTYLRTSEEMEQAILRCDVSTDADPYEHRYWLSAPWEEPQGLDSLLDIEREVIQNLDINQVVGLGLSERLQDLIRDEPRDHDWDEHLNTAMVNQNEELVEMLLPVAPLNDSEELLMSAMDFTTSDVVERILAGTSVNADLSDAFAHAVQEGHEDCAILIREHQAQRQNSYIRSELNTVTPGMEQRQQRRM